MNKYLNLILYQRLLIRNESHAEFTAVRACLLILLLYCS